MFNFLGKEVTYADRYDPELLQPIPRSLCRQQIGIHSSLPFESGFDLWNCYEVSWRNSKNKPQVRVLEFIVPFTSEFIVESKSLKLYLNSLNNTNFADDTEVEQTIWRDLTKLLNSEIHIELKPLAKFQNQVLTNFEGIDLDTQDIIIANDDDITSDLLKLSDKDINIKEQLYSNLLKSNCLATKQPDWASLQISYEGKMIDHSALLRYIISFRNHNEFHEQCVERIFKDITNVCTPRELTVYARYTRRGGIDINPIRSTRRDLNTTALNNLRHFRQ